MVVAEVVAVVGIVEVEVEVVVVVMGVVVKVVVEVVVAVLPAQDASSIETTIKKLKPITIILLFIFYLPFDNDNRIAALIASVNQVIKNFVDDGLHDQNTGFVTSG